MTGTRVDEVCEELLALTSVRAVFVVDEHRRCVARAGSFDENETRLLLSLAHERPDE
jgi:hypothetical protein